MRIPEAALARIVPAPMQARRVLAEADDCASVPPPGASLADALCALPSLGAARDFFAWRDALVQAHARKRPVLLGLGARALRTGLGPWAARLLEEGWISGVVLTGQALVHDVEMALFGLLADPDAHAGAPAEVGALIAEAVQFAAEEGIGIGEGVGRWLADRAPEHLAHSALGTAARFGLGAFVHLAPAVDAVQLHPDLHGEALGAAAMRDFARLVGMLGAMEDGIVVVLASSAVLPRVLAQAARAASALGATAMPQAVFVDAGAPTSAVADMFASLGGKELRLTGPAELLAPLAFATARDMIGTKE